MKPITDHIPKPLIPVVGTPLVNRIIDRLATHKIDRIGVNVHYKAEQLRQYFKKQFKNKVLVSHEPVLLGTGGALTFFKDFVTTSFIVHSGDVMTDADVSKIIDYHEKHGPMITLALIKNNDTDYIRIDDENNVVKIATDTHPGKTGYYTFSGISVFSSEIYSVLPERDVFSMVEIFRNVLDRGGAIKGIPCSLTWYNLNSCKTLWELHRDILHKKASFDDINVAEAFYIDTSSRVETSNLEGFVSIGARCTVDKTVRLQNAILFNDTHVTNGSFCDCILSDRFCVHVNA